jgi:predicted PurR-regulated permease PerM
MEFKKRFSGVILTYVSILLVIYLIVFIVLKRLNVSGSRFFEDLAVNTSKLSQSFSDKYIEFQIILEEWGILSYVSNFLSRIIVFLTSYVNNLSQIIVNVLKNAGKSMLKFLLSFIIAFYMLVNKDLYISLLDKYSNMFISKRILNSIKLGLSIVHDIFSNYIKGQLIDAVIMTVLISTWLSILNLDFAILIGAISGFSNIIPYVGSFIGLLLAVISAMFSGDYLKVVYCIIGIIVLQQIDGTIIVPKIIGERVNLSPLVVILALYMSSELFGIVGMIVAVPVFAIIKRLANKLLLDYKDRIGKV